MVYKLPPYVYVRIFDTGAVWLDLRKDKYFGQHSEDVRGFESFVAGWPGDPKPDAAKNEYAQNVLAQLEKAGLLTLEPSGKGAEATSLVEPVFSLSDDDGAAPPRILHIACLLLCCLSTKLAQHWSLEYAVSRIARRNRKRRRDTEQARAIGKTIYLAKVYQMLRPFIHGADGRCLYDSLVLMEFMAWFHVYPNFVIGVDKRPFSAHSWVQAGLWVLNDRAARVQRYYPILAA